LFSGRQDSKEKHGGGQPPFFASRWAQALAARWLTPASKRQEGGTRKRVTALCLAPFGRELRRVFLYRGRRMTACRCAGDIPTAPGRILYGTATPLKRWRARAARSAGPAVARGRTACTGRRPTSTRWPRTLRAGRCPACAR